ncbi:unnamed protein product [Angiostrongylus costaricensis]|uniref:UPF0126 domain-containing protein n=1 Tax=Angiostrongylus costaricensis TaxID=334426 RepID=A0A0R3PLN3_ANGCS|nr:unnamed protein product [Angiostrongylus costaricensis]
MRDREGEPEKESGPKRKKVKRISEQPSLGRTMEELGEEKKWKKESFFKKYFCEGQHLDESWNSREVADDADLIDVVLVKYRKYVAVLIPLVLMQTLWWLTAIRYSWLSLYATHWHLPATMIVGSTIAGMTSEGGGAVAFPVMTLGLGIAPTVARDFSLIVQSIGMSCAVFVVVFMNVQIEKRAVIFGMLGSVPGFVFGSFLIDPLLTAPQKKMLFVSIWSSFAIALYMLNDEKRRKTYLVIPVFKLWKALVLVCTGIVGGIFTAFTGSGVDICIFSIITLLFRVSEKTATPTTIVLMVTVPVAVTLAPIGSFVGSHFHRKVSECFNSIIHPVNILTVLASFIYVLEGLAVAGFLAAKPPLTLGEPISLYESVAETFSNEKKTDESEDMLAA